MITRCSFETKVILNHQINTRFMRRNLNVLVVDDEAPAPELMCRQIERSCPSLSVVQTASNAKEARHYIDSISPDVVFVDIRMPNESGRVFFN